MSLVEPLIFPEPLARFIEQVDFQKSFVILGQHGHAEVGLVTKVTRQGRTIVISTTDSASGCVSGNKVDMAKIIMPCRWKGEEERLRGK